MSRRMIPGTQTRTPAPHPSTSRISGSSAICARGGRGMPKLPLPPEVDRMLRKANPAVIGTLRADGSPHTAVTWYDWDGERVLVNMDSTRLRLKNLRRDPRATVTVMDGESWYRQVTLRGRAVEIRDDPEF